MDVRDHVLHRQQKYRDEANAGIAAAIAMEAAPYLPDHITYAIGSGYYGNQGAIGVTLRATAENGRWSVTTGASTSERSEAHTSELQSLMRTSYAVFCLKKTT